MKMKKVLVLFVAMMTIFAFTACGGSGGGTDADKPEPVSTESGAISVTPLDMPDYITSAESGNGEDILIAKEGDGSGSGEYIYIDGSCKDEADATWELRCPSYVYGQEYTFDMLKADLQAEDPYFTFTDVKIGDQDYVSKEANSEATYYYTVANNHPVLIQVIGESMLGNDKVMECLETIQYNY